MNIDKELEKLNRIRRVEPPPFLYTRIRAGIEELPRQQAPLKWRLATVGIFVILLALNIGILRQRYAATRSTEILQMASSMQLSNSNELYHE